MVSLRVAAVKQETCFNSSSMVISMVCVPSSSPASDVSLCIGSRTLQPTRLECQSEHQDPSHVPPTESPTGRSTQNRAVCFITLSHASTLVTAANDLPAHDATIPQHHKHCTGPTSALITTFSPCLAWPVGIADPTCLFVVEEFMGRSRTAATTRTRISFVIAKLGQNGVRRTPLVVFIRSSLLLSVCEFHKKTHFVAGWMFIDLHG